MEHSVIDLTLAGPGAGPDCRGSRVVAREEDATMSDHEMIEWRWEGLTMKVDPKWKMRGWALKERLDNEKAEEEGRKRGGPRAGPTLRGFWTQRTGAWPALGEWRGYSPGDRP